ncbi:MAG TPA: hypothetical protein VFD71_18285 [Planctomycetota bacterium]|nr:hypothetical protein [Planctomycetota bacterium]
MSSTRTFRRRIGEILVNDGVASPEQIEEALVVQKSSGDLLGSILMDMGVVSEADIARTLCVQYQLPFICLANYEVDEKIVKLFPKQFLHKHKVLPFDKVGKMILLMVAEIPPEPVLEEIPKITRLDVALYVGYFSEVDTYLQKICPLQEVKKPAAPDKGAGQAARVQIVGGATSDEDDDGDIAGVFGDDKGTFLEELDTTWEQIFTKAEGKGGK